MDNSISINVYNIFSWLVSWIFARNWPEMVQGRHLSTLCSFLSLLAWVIVLSPIMMVIIWGSILIYLIDRDIIGLAVIMAGTALLLAFYSIMLWWRTQWQSSSMYFSHFNTVKVDKIHPTFALNFNLILKFIFFLSND